LSQGVLTNGKGFFYSTNYGVTWSTMANVTDAAFRRVIAKYGKPDVTWTEFVSADGLALAPEEGRAKLLRDLVYDESERPIVAQFFGSRPENMYLAGRLAVKLGFDGADINMGCPDKAVMRQKAGAALIKNPALARELIRSLRQGALDEAAERGVPMIGISVKTRIGYSKSSELGPWITALLEEPIDALIIHARTMKEMSKVPARWEHIAEAVAIRDARAKKTLILGNGDIASMADARARVAASGADGAMLGRAIFGNPWLFSDKGNDGGESDAAPEISKEEKLRVMLEHTKLFDELLGDIKNFALMKKHYKAYVNGFDGAKELRVQLMEAENVADVERMLAEHGY
jgi:nifR3 family TIM-barrel protein